MFYQRYEGQEGGGSTYKPTSCWVRGSETSPSGNESRSPRRPRHGQFPYIHPYPLLFLTSTPQIKAPQITSYRWPRRANSTILIYAIMLYITFPDAVPKSPLFQPARAINAAIGGSNTMLRIWQAWFGIHFLEALYTLSLCRRHSTPLVTGVRTLIIIIIIIISCRFLTNGLCCRPSMCLARLFSDFLYGLILGRGFKPRGSIR